MPDSPNRANAVGEKVQGGIMNAAGVLQNALTGDDSLKKKGEEKINNADQTYSEAQAADKAEAKGDEVKGNIKDTAGKIGDAMGIDNNLRSEGQADKAQADVKDAKSQI